MRHTIGRVLDKIGSRLMEPFRYDWRQDRDHRCSKEGQLILYHMYREMAARRSLPAFSDVGFRCYSQFEEDGILLYIFALIGTTNKTVVEICAGDGTECMATNLLLNHGWWGHLFDGNEDNVRRGQGFFSKSRDTLLSQPSFSRAWVTAENVNQIVTASGAVGNVDLLSLDIDGMDYWVWQALESIRPRVVVCETHNIFSHEQSLTVPYDPKFVLATPDYHGASLAAMTKMAAKKGYRLVGTHRHGFNAFFILDDLSPDLLPTVMPSECLGDPYSVEARRSRWPKVSGMNWIEV